MEKANKVIEAAMADLNSNPEWNEFIDGYKEKYNKVFIALNGDKPGF